MLAIHSPALRDELQRFVSQARAPRLRTMLQFAEEEIVLPNGPFAGRRFRSTRQPYMRVWFGEVDSGAYTRVACVGPSQSGKTLLGFTIPILYHLFEIGETVILGAPSMDVAQDKWQLDLLPAIERSRYADLLPRRGGGSKGGKSALIKFSNGAKLRFMTGGGGDKARAGFTARVVAVTETDGMDEAAEGSREADAIEQLEARTRAFGSAKRVYLECTASVPEGRIWQEYTRGTESRLLSRCPRCSAWISPDREHVTGWREAGSEHEARELARWQCPSCGSAISEEERAASQLGLAVVHRGQEIEGDGRVSGLAPRTETLGFRWSAWNNLFTTAGDLGVDEFRTARAAHEEAAERKMLQFVWGRPYVPPRVEGQELDEEKLVRRVDAAIPRGIVSKTSRAFTAGLDIGKYLAHWVAVDWQEDGSSRVADYGRLEVASDDLGVDQAVATTLREFRDTMESRFYREDGGTTTPGQAWIDAGYMGDVVKAFSKATGNRRYRAVHGRGETAGSTHVNYFRPKTTGKVVVHLGEEYHLVWDEERAVHAVEMNVDYWKTWVHARLGSRSESGPAMRLFPAPAAEHTSFAKHVTAEKRVERFVEGRGTVQRWERLRRNNHWLDALVYASCAAHLCGVRLQTKISEIAVAVAPMPTGIRGGLRMPDGRPYLTTTGARA